MTDHDIVDKITANIEKSLLRGFIRLSILLVLEKTNEYGYRIYKVVKERVYGRLSLSTFYTILKELEEHNVIKKVGDVYTITDKGAKVLEHIKSKYRDIALSIEKLLA